MSYQPVFKELPPAGVGFCLLDLVTYWEGGVHLVDNLESKVPCFKLGCRSLWALIIKDGSYSSGGSEERSSVDCRLGAYLRIKTVTPTGPLRPTGEVIGRIGVGRVRAHVVTLQ